MNFADKLHNAVRCVGNPCVLGIDPHIDFLPDEFCVVRDKSASRAARALAMTKFCLDLLELGHRRVCAVKLQSAFFEELGSDGARAWEAVVVAAHELGYLVVGDVKRGDIASTAAAYGRAFLGSPYFSDEGHLCDAITVNPYLGGDSIEPFMSICEKSDRGIFILVRTSNPGASDFQLHGIPPLWQEVAHQVDRWGSQLVGACGMSSIGAVVGATHPKEVASFRAALPRSPLLLPGYGAQGASAAGLVDAFLPNGHGALVSSSRGIGFAYRRYPGLPWKDAAHNALNEMIADITKALLGRRSPMGT